MSETDGFEFDPEKSLAADVIPTDTAGVDSTASPVGDAETSMRVALSLLSKRAVIPPEVVREVLEWGVTGYRDLL
jgi:hypothetical protein